MSPFLYVNPPDQTLLVPGFAKTLHGPQLVANGLLLNDEVVYRLAWDACEGLVEPATLEPGEDFESLGGISHVEPWVDAYPARRVVLAGRILGQADYLTKFRQVSAIARAFVHRPVRAQIGSLYMDMDVVAFRVPRDPFKKLPDRVSWELEGKAVPGLWLAAYGFATGTDQGIPCADDRPDQAGWLATVPAGSGNGIFTWTNQGDAPANVGLALSMSTPAYWSTTVYVRNQDPRYPAQVPVNLDALGVGEIFPDAGLLVAPGLNWLRVEDVDGNLLDGPIVASFFGTRFRYHGNSVDRRFSEGPILFCGFRTGRATYTRWDNVIVEAADQEPRAGVPFGDYFPAKSGLILEQAGTNYVKNSYFADGALTDWDLSPSPTVSIARAVTAIDPLPYQGSVCRIAAADMPSGQGAAAEQSIDLPAGTPRTWTMSAGCTNDLPNLAGLQAALEIIAYDVAGDAVGAWKLAYTLGKEDQVKSLTMDLPVAAVRVLLRAIVGSTGGGFAGTVSGTVDFFNVQLERVPLQTSFMPSGPGKTGSREADVVAVWAPHNYLPGPRDFGDWWVSDPAQAPTRDAVNPAADGTMRAWRWNPVSPVTLRRGITPDVPPGSAPWTFALTARLEAGDEGPTIALSLIDNKTGVAFASGNARLSTDTRTYFITGTPPATCIDFDAAMFAVGGGPFVLESARVVQGRHPGAEIHSRGAAIVHPKNVWEWLDSATQNGRLKFTAVLPPPTTGFEYAIVGDYNTGDCCLYRPASGLAASNRLRLVKRTNGNQVVRDIDFGDVFDGEPHVLELEWLNYQVRKTGERVMVLRAYVDGELKTADENYVTLLIWEWKRPERLWASDGKAQAVLSDIGFAVPDLPFGAIPVSS